MGGHGGLNILPQKKWNVYNHDNRAIVQKDKKQQAKKKRSQFQLKRKQNLINKMEVLKDQKESDEEKEQERDNLIVSELRKLNQQNKHVNLFEQEQKIIQNRQILQCQKLKEEEWLKDKNMDYSSKFLGTYNNQQKVPWYLKHKSYKSNKVKNESYQLDLIYDQLQQSLINQRKIQRKKNCFFKINASQQLSSKH